MRSLLFSIGAPVLVFLAGCNSTPGPDRSAPVVDFAAPGPTEDGAVLLPNQWYLRPAGKQILLGDFPVNIAVHPGGKFAAVLHSVRLTSWPMSHESAWLLNLTPEIAVVRSTSGVVVTAARTFP